MKIAVIINPVSGKGAGLKFFNKIDAVIKSSDFIDSFLTTKPLEAIQIAKKCADYDRIIICGGDGTLHEVINGLELGAHQQLGLIPIGTGNDFALAFDILKINPITLFEKYISNKVKTKEVNFGNVFVEDTKGARYNRRMINSFGTGFDAKVAYYNQSNKVFNGTFSYIYSILKALVEFSRINFRAKFDKEEISGEALFCAVGNGKTIGGGLYLMPNAIVDDDFLDLSIVTIKSRFKLLTMLPKAIKNRLSGYKELQEYRFKNMELSLNTPFYLHIDGEIISESAKKISISISDSKLNFITYQ